MNRSSILRNVFCTLIVFSTVCSPVFGMDKNNQGGCLSRFVKPFYDLFVGDGADVLEKFKSGLAEKYGINALHFLDNELVRDKISLGLSVEDIREDIVPYLDSDAKKTWRKFESVADKKFGEEVVFLYLDVLCVLDAIYNDFSHEDILGNIGCYLRSEKPEVVKKFGEFERFMMNKLKCGDEVDLSGLNVLLILKHFLGEPPISLEAIFGNIGFYTIDSD